MLGTVTGFLQAHTLTTFIVNQAKSLTFLILCIVMITPKHRYFLQSTEWAAYQRALGHTVFEESGEGWQYVAIVERGYGVIGSRFKRLYAPYGPTAVSIEAMHQAMDDLERLGKTAGVDYLRVEPVVIGIDNSALNFDGLKKAKRSFQPDRTLIIDINRSLDDVLQSVSKTNRYLWNKAERNGLYFKVTYDENSLSHFLDMMRETAERTQTKFKADFYYKALIEVLGPHKSAGVAYAFYGDEPLVGVLFADDMKAKTRYYLYAGSFDAARKHSANAPLVVYLFKDAQDKGLTSFDFFGVAPADEVNHRWAGFSKFKRSFGGEELCFSGTYEKPINIVRYSLMEMARRFV